MEPFVSAALETKEMFKVIGRKLLVLPVCLIDSY